MPTGDALCVLKADTVNHAEERNHDSCSPPAVCGSRMGYSPQAHVAITWSPISAVLLGGSGSFRLWNLDEGNRSLGVGHWAYIISGYFLSCSLLLVNHVN